MDNPFHPRSPGNCRAAARGATESEFPLDAVGNWYLGLQGNGPPVVVKGSLEMFVVNFCLREFALEQTLGGTANL